MLETLTLKSNFSTVYRMNAKVVKIKCLVVIHLEKGHNLRLPPILT